MAVMTTEPRPVVPEMELREQLREAEALWDTFDSDVDAVLDTIEALGYSIVASDTIDRVRRELQEVNQSCDGLLYLTPEDCAALGWSVDWQSDEPLAGGDR